MASEMEELLQMVAEDMCPIMSTTPGYALLIEGNLELLNRRLLPLLEAGADMRYQEWPVDMAYGPAKDWDEALAAAKKG